MNDPCASTSNPHIRRSGIRPSTTTLHNLAREAHNLHESALTQLPSDRAENAGATRIAVVIDKHHRVRIESHIAAVRAPRGGLRADDHAPHHRLLLDIARLHGVLHAADD